MTTSAHHRVKPRSLKAELQQGPLEFRLQPAQLGIEQYLAHATTTASAHDRVKLSSLKAELQRHAEWRASCQPGVEQSDDPRYGVSRPADPNGVAAQACAAVHGCGISV